MKIVLRCMVCENTVTKPLQPLSCGLSGDFYNVDVIDEESQMFKYTFKSDLIDTSLDTLSVWCSNTEDFVKSPVYVLNPYSLLNVNLQKSRGCCSFDRAEVFCRCCDTNLGDARDDCWQDTNSFIVAERVTLEILK